MPMKCIRCRNESIEPFCSMCMLQYDVQNRHHQQPITSPNFCRDFFISHKSDFASIDDAEFFLSENGTIGNLAKVLRYAHANGYASWEVVLKDDVKRNVYVAFYGTNKGEDITVQFRQVRTDAIHPKLRKTNICEFVCRWNDFGEVRKFLLEECPYTVVVSDSITRRWEQVGVASENESIVRWYAGNMKTSVLVVNRGQIKGGERIALVDGRTSIFENLFEGSVSHGEIGRNEYGRQWTAPATIKNLNTLLERCSVYQETGIDACVELYRLVNRDEWIHKGLIWRRMTELYKPSELHRYVYNETKKAEADPFDPFGLMSPSTIKDPVPELEEWDKYLNVMKPFSQQKIAAELAYRTRYIGYWMDMRVGKTPTAMMVARRMLLEKEVEQVFFVAPAVNVYDPWLKELEKQGWFRVCVLDEGRQQDEWNLMSGKYNAFVVSYDTLLTRQNAISAHIELTKTGWVFDETSLIKRYDAKRSKVSMDMSEHSVFTLCLNGTPMAQGPSDLWPQQFVYDRGATFGVTYHKFLADFTQKNGTKTIVQRGKEMLFELMISASSVRYLRSEADQFSGKDKNFRYVNIPPTEQMRESTKLIIEHGITICSGEDQEIKNNILVVYGHLREACAGYDKFEILKDSGKYRRVRHQIDPKVLWLKVFLKSNPGQPVICFTEFSESEDMIMEMLEEEGYEYSSMRTKYSKSPRGNHERSEEIRKFQEGETQVFIMKSTQAKGVTLNRIPAVEAGIGSYPVICYFQPSWSLVDWEQSQDRAVGTDPKTNKSISTMIYCLVIRGSIEAEILKALRRKKKVAETLLADAERNGYSNPFSEMDMSDAAQSKTEADDTFDAYEYECRYHLEISPGKKLTEKNIKKALEKFPQHREYADYLLQKLTEETSTVETKVSTKEAS